MVQAQPETPPLPTGEADAEGPSYAAHTVVPGETLTSIAEMYSTSVAELMSINGLADANLLQVDQVLLVPGRADVIGPAFNVIPDSELIYGPSAADFDVRAAVNRFGGALATFSEEVEGQALSGAEVVSLIANRFSVNPRLLLTFIEHRAGWLTTAADTEQPFPLGFERRGLEGLYFQLHSAANLANLGFYGRSEGGLRIVELGDGTQVALAAAISGGTSGVQLMLSGGRGVTYWSWFEDVGPGGFQATYRALFGDPFANEVEQSLPSDLRQPDLLLPWPVGETWYLTSGPHGAWASGSAWGALDFAPDDERLGCYQSDARVTAMSDGQVVRSGFGAVVVDLDGDGYAGTGWALTYMHLETRDRVSLGQEVKAGDRLGHPSCEGGFSNGTHLHVVRSYNGRWVSADGSLPFILSGWVSQGQGREYDGLLVKGDQVKEACTCREESNAILHD
jgi:LasA protease